LGKVLGIVGANGIGKSTALKILSGEIQPNLGHFDNPPDWKAIIKRFRGSELQNYFSKLIENEMKAVIKIQYVDRYKNKNEAQRIVGEKLEALDNTGRRESVIEKLNLENILDRQVKDLSGGELQRYFIAKACVQNAGVYMFDEPSSYLDVKQRLKAARAIRELNTDDNYIICVDHDLSILDYLSDYVCCLYGSPEIYGVVTMPYSVSEGINIFLAGFIPSEKIRFRYTELPFKIFEDKKDEEEDETALQKVQIYNYPKMTKTLGSFKLEIEEGKFTDSEIIVLLGENGTGKSTLIHILAGILKPDDEEAKLPPLVFSIKPQKITPKFQGSVESLLKSKLGDTLCDPVFNTKVIKPLNIQPLFDNDLQTLSGGEIQRVALTLTLGKKCDVYLIDEPSAFLDSEQRLIAAKVIKQWVVSTKKSALIVEHDLIMASYLADKVIVFDSISADETFCLSPEGLVPGMNRFLKMLEITFRRDPTNYRPRINKHLSQKDQEQKASECYFLTDEGQIFILQKGRELKKPKDKANKERKKMKEKQSKNKECDKRKKR
jgi:ATP-binding cassette, sub-family E, member 1